MKSTSEKMRLIALMLICNCIGCSLNGQRVSLSEYKSYSFVKDSLNVIKNDSALFPFYEELIKLKKDNVTIVSILHIGDSHLQADLLTALVRTKMQLTFGNAGRGLIVPLKVAKTNEPSNYGTSSTSVWQSKRCVFPNNPMPIGIGGVTINSSESNASLNVKTFNTQDLDYSFNNATLFHQNDTNNYTFSVQVEGKNSKSEKQNYSPFYSVYRLANSTNEITFNASKQIENQNQATIYGMSLENGKAGVLYHTVGVNGAQYQHFNKAIYFAEQSKYLHPNLIIISLGTNEGYDTNFDSAQFYKQIESLVYKLKYYNPSAAFILTTPANSYYKGGYNSRLPIITKTILSFAKDNNLATWDLEEIGGGSRSAYNWKKNGLLARDGVHYIKSGYELQGNLLQEAILKSYNNYVVPKP